MNYPTILQLCEHSQFANTTIKKAYDYNNNQ